MNQDHSENNPAVKLTLQRLKDLGQISKFLSSSINDLSEESDYFLAKQALQDFSSSLDVLPLTTELKEDTRHFVEFLSKSIEEKYQSHRG
jgi:hypothetical protein